MQVILCDGFERYFTPGSKGMSASHFGTDSVEWTNSNPRTGQGCMVAAPDTSPKYAYLQYSLGGHVTSDVAISFAFKRVSGPEALSFKPGQSIAQLSDGTQPIGVVAINVAGYLQVYVRDADETAAKDEYAVPYPTGEWHHISFRCRGDEVTGLLAVFLDGVEVCSWTGDTLISGATTAASLVNLGVVYDTDVTGEYGCEAVFHFDDLVVWDMTGEADNVVPPVTRVVAVSPILDGTHGAWTTTGTFDYTEVDDGKTWPAQSDDAVTMLSSSTTSQKFSLDMESLPAGVTAIHGVELLVKSANSDVTPDNMRLMQLNNGTLYYGANIAPGTLWNWYRKMWATDPDAVADWLAATVDALEFGVERVT